MFEESLACPFSVAGKAKAFRSQGKNQIYFSYKATRIDAFGAHPPSISFTFGRG